MIQMNQISLNKTQRTKTESNKKGNSMHSLSLSDLRTS